MHEFKKGDIVRLKAGRTPMVVTNSKGVSLVEVAYCKSDPRYDPDTRLVRASKLILVTDAWDFKDCHNWAERLTDEQHEQLARQTNQTERTNTMMKLYQTKEDTPRFGTKLATNSEGKMVLEMKGTGTVEVFDSAAVEEVKPYTVAVRFLNSSSTGRNYQFRASKGDVEVGDLLLLEKYDDVAKVTKLDTKSDRATADLKGRKLVSTSIGDNIEPVVEDD